MPGIQRVQKLAELLQYGTQVLQNAGIQEARLDTELILGYCLNKSRTALYLAADQPVEKHSVEQFMSMLTRRKKREPLSYITGEKEFWSLPFNVSPAVLIPRPETEFLLETVFDKRNNRGIQKECLDLCCGSGVIAVVLAIELDRQVIAVDISSKALEVTKKNVLRHRVDTKVRLVQSDLLTCFQSKKTFSLIVSNPPYVRRAEIAEELEPEVADYEPLLALDGGESGLDIITSIRDCLPELLDRGGDCFLEIGDRQGEAVRSLFLSHEYSAFYDYVKVLQDYSGRDRVVHIRRSEN